MYFNAFEKGIYDIKGDGNYKYVTDLLTRIKIKSGVDNDTFLYDKYTVPSGDTPEDVSYYHFKSSIYHWVILMTNNVTDRYTGWPMDQITFELYLEDKYQFPNATHHYEITKDSGVLKPQGPADYSHLIQVSSDITGATAITNREYEEREQDKRRQINLLNPNLLPAFLKEFDRLMQMN